MKNLMKVFSLVLCIAFIVVIMALLIEGNADYTIFAVKILTVLILNILPIISIALCCFCLERGDTNHLLRIIPIYMLVSIFISVLLVFFYTKNLTDLSIINSILGTASASTKSVDFGDTLANIYSFMSSTHLCLTLVSLLFMVQTNNAVSTIMKRIAYIALAINVLLSLWMNLKAITREKLPNVTNYEEYNLSINNYTSYTDSGLAEKVYTVSVVVESFTVIALFITNYAFSSDKEYVAADIDYDALEEQLKVYSTMQMSKINDTVIKQQPLFATEPPKEIIKDASQTGIMNISNQLGNNSNVGQVKESAKEMNITANQSMDMVMPFSSGPVINESVMPKQEVVTEPVTEAPKEVVYQDVNNLMQQANNQNNNQNNI